MKLVLKKKSQKLIKIKCSIKFQSMNQSLKVNSITLLKKLVTILFNIQAVIIYQLKWNIYWVLLISQRLWKINKMRMVLLELKLPIKFMKLLMSELFLQAIVWKNIKRERWKNSIERSIWNLFDNQLNITKILIFNFL